MKKALAIGLPVIIVLGFGVYAEVVGWINVVGFLSPPAVEEKISGTVSNFRAMNYSDDSVAEYINHINIFTLISSGGEVVNLGIDYDNIAFKDGDAIEVVFVRKLQKKNGIAVDNKVNYKAQWYPVLSYRLLTKIPVSAEK